MSENYLLCVSHYLLNVCMWFVYMGLNLCVCVLRLCFLALTELRKFCNKSTFMLLHLICIALMGICCTPDCVWCSRSAHANRFVCRYVHKMEK